MYITKVFLGLDTLGDRALTLTLDFVASIEGALYYPYHNKNSLILKFLITK